MHSCIRYVIRTRKRGGDILYAQDYNTDTHLPRFRKVYELSGPVEINSGQYVVIGDDTLNPPLIFLHMNTYAKGHIEVTNTQTVPWLVHLYFETTIMSGDISSTNRGNLVKRLRLEPGQTLSTEFYTADWFVFDAMLADRMYTTLHLEILDANTLSIISGVSGTVKDVVVYLEA